MNHFDNETLKAFVAGKLSPAETREVASHLLQGCEECQGEAQKDWHSPTATGAPRRTNSEIRWSRLADQLASRERDVEREKENAATISARLLSKPLGSRLMLVRNEPSFRTWAVVEALLDHAWALRFDDVPELIETAQTALACADCLDAGKYGTGVHDLRARCWSNIGNGMGILRDFTEAEACHRRARAELKQGSGDPLEKANWLRLQVGLRLRQGLLEEAAHLAERYLALVQRVGDHHEIGKAKNLLGGVRAQQGHVEEAIDLLQESVEMLDPADDPRAVANSMHNLVAMLDEAGRSSEALSKLGELRSLYEKLGDRLSLLRLTVTEGEIAAGMNNRLLAERCFLQARNGLVACELPIEAAEATLELAMVYLSDGRFKETARLADQMVPIFQAKGLVREAMAALLIFREAALRESLTSQMVAETLKLIRSVQSDA